MTSNSSSTSKWHWLTNVDMELFGLKLKASESMGIVSIEVPRNHCGRISIKGKNPKERLDILLQPKIAHASISGMLDVALKMPEDYDTDVNEFTADVLYHPSGWIAQTYIRALKRFSDHIRPRGIEIEEELRGRVRGRILVSQYAQRNFPTRQHHIPCRYTEWTVDNLPNQILRHALRLSIQTLKQFEEEEVSPIARKLDRDLGEITDRKPTLNDLSTAKATLGASFRHYTPILNHAEAIIRCLDPFAEGDEWGSIPEKAVISNGSSENGDVRWDLVKMDDLFERFVANMLQMNGSTEETSLPYKSGSKKSEDYKYPLKPGDKGEDSPLETFFVTTKKAEERSKRVELDVVPIGKDIVVDSKWKHPHKGLNNADMFQLVAYATHEEIMCKCAGLIYPMLPINVRAEMPKTYLSGSTITSVENELIELKDDLPAMSDVAPLDIEYEKFPDNYSPRSWTGLGFREGAKDGIPVFPLLVRVDEEGIELELNTHRTAHIGLSKQLEKIRQYLKEPPRKNESGSVVRSILAD